MSGHGPDYDWEVYSTGTHQRVLNGWLLTVRRRYLTGLYLVEADHDQQERRLDDQISGLINALIIAEGFATDPEPPPPGVRDRLLLAVRDELQAGAA